MEMQEIYSIENNVLVGMKQPIISCYDDYLKHDYLIPEEVTAIKGKDFVPFAMNKSHHSQYLCTASDYHSKQGFALL